MRLLGCLPLASQSAAALSEALSAPPGLDRCGHLLVDSRLASIDCQSQLHLKGFGALGLSGGLGLKGAPPALSLKEGTVGEWISDRLLWCSTGEEK